MVIIQDQINPPISSADYENLVFTFHIEHMPKVRRNYAQGGKLDFTLQKFYVNNILKYFLDNEQHNLVDHFTVPSEIFIETMKLGLLQKTDFSSYVIYCFNKYAENSYKTPGDKVNNDENLLTIFSNANSLTLNKEASKALITWVGAEITKQGLSEAGVYTWLKYSNSPLYIEYDEEYRVFLKNWLRKTRAKTKKLKTTLNVHLGILKHWLNKTEPSKVPFKVAQEFFFEIKKGHNLVNLYNKNTSFVDWVLEVSYAQLVPYRGNKEFVERDNVLLFLNYNSQSKIELTEEEKLSCKLFAADYPNEFEMYLGSFLRKGLINNIVKLVKDFPEYKNIILKHVAKNGLVLPPELLPSIHESDIPYEKINVHDDMPVVAKAYSYLKMKSNFPKGLFDADGELWVTQSCEEMGVSRTDGMPDRYLLSILKSLV